MKRYFILIAAYCCLAHLSAQSKYDYVWTLGYGDTLTVPSNGISVGGIIMDFHTEPPTLTRVPFYKTSPLAFINNVKGELLAYTNGCKVSNRMHKDMQNGEEINLGKVQEKFCGSNSSTYPLWQGFLFLPLPGSQDSVYCLLHLRKDDIYWRPEQLLLSTINANLDNGLGGVVIKDKLLLTDTLLSHYITATRHANGRDWWVIAPRTHVPQYQLFLLDPTGVHYQGVQELGATDTKIYESQICFSADGSKFIKNWPSGLSVFDFDRCTGLLSNPVYIAYDSTFKASGGVVTSPNSRFLYLFGFSKVWQYDFWATDFKASRQTVAVYDGFLSPFQTGFFQAMRGPNGKIYSVTSSTNNVLHVIHHPNEPGLACEVEQHGVILPALTDFFMPNMADYRLGALAGSPCDSLTVSAPAPGPLRYEPAGLDVYPNPGTEEVTFEQLSGYAGQGGHLTMSDLSGRVVVEAEFRAGEPVLHLHVQALARGMYVWSYTRVDGRKAVGRWVKEE